MTRPHPSFYRLDQVRFGLALDDHQRAHVAGCPECAEHLRASAGPVPLPSWLAGVTLAARGQSLPSPKRAEPARLLRCSSVKYARYSPSSRLAAGPAAPISARSDFIHGLLGRPRRRRWGVLLGAGAAVVALLVFVARPADEVRSKGGPAVVVFVKRGDDVFTWNGDRPVHPGDRLRLRLDGAGYRYASVASVPGGGDPPALLYEGTLGATPELLPLSFRVDEREGAETLSIVLGRHPIPADRHRPDRPDDDQVWRKVLVLDKAPSDNEGRERP